MSRAYILQVIKSYLNSLNEFSWHSGFAFKLACLQQRCCSVKNWFDLSWPSVTELSWGKSWKDHFISVGKQPTEIWYAGWAQSAKASVFWALLTLRCVMSQESCYGLIRAGLLLPALPFSILSGHHCVAAHAGSCWKQAMPSFPQGPDQETKRLVSKDHKLQGV